MPLVTLQEESRDQNNFYAPQFEIKIEGVGLPRDILRDVIQITYKDNIKELDSFELTINNWNPTTRTFKYVGAETKESLRESTPESQRFRLFEPCQKKVEVRMGYVGGSMQLMMKGSTTTMEPNFPQSGGSTLTVRGLNVLHELRKKQFTNSWKDMRDSEIAEDIATLRVPEKDCRKSTTRPKLERRFPLPIVVSEAAKAKEPYLPNVAQKSQYDIDFLLCRARQRGYVVYVKEGNPRGRGAERQQHLYFGPSDATDAPPAARDVTFVLKSGVSLIDFKPTLTTANQVKSVMVKGWNRRTRQCIRGSVDLQHQDLRINTDLYYLLEECDQREEIVVDEPVFTPAQAEKRALALLRERLKQMVQASGTCVGLPDLRAGQRVEIEGIGSRFSGTYFVTETTHTINDKGYQTKFSARREQIKRGKDK